MGARRSTYRTRDLIQAIVGIRRAGFPSLLGAVQTLGEDNMAQHDFSKTPDQCPRCRERRENGRKLAPASVPGIIHADRLAKIHALPTARGREKTARHLALFDIAIDVVAAALSAAPRDAEAVNSLGLFLMPDPTGRRYQ